MTMNGRSVVIGLFRDRREAEAALGALREAGFPDEAIGIAAQPGALPDGASADRASGPPTFESGAGIGMLSGAALGGLAAGGLPGMVVGGVTGGLIAALIDLGIPETTARGFEDEINAGQTMVIARTDDRLDEAADLLRRQGAEQVQSVPRPGGAAPAG